MIMHHGKRGTSLDLIAFFGPCVLISLMVTTRATWVSPYVRCCSRVWKNLKAAADQPFLACMYDRQNSAERNPCKRLCQQRERSYLSMSCPLNDVTNSGYRRNQPNCMDTRVKKFLNGTTKITDWFRDRLTGYLHLLKRRSCYTSSTKINLLSDCYQGGTVVAVQGKKLSQFSGIHSILVKES